MKHLKQSSMEQTNAGATNHWKDSATLIPCEDQQAWTKLESTKSGPQKPDRLRDTEECDQLSAQLAEKLSLEEMPTHARGCGKDDQKDATPHQQQFLESPVDEILAPEIYAGVERYVKLRMTMVRTAKYGNNETTSVKESEHAELEALHLDLLPTA